MEFDITESAARRIADLIKKNDNQKQFLRISVEGGGCSGFQYKYEFAYNKDPEDFVKEKDSIMVIIDPISQQYMNGCQLDFIQTLGNSYFEIKNPQALAKCGCGNSFTV